MSDFGVEATGGCMRWRGGGTDQIWWLMGSEVRRGEKTWGLFCSLESSGLYLFFSHIMYSDITCSASLLSHVRLFVAPWTVAHQAPLSIAILQTRTLEWVAYPFSVGSSQPRDQTKVSHIAGHFFSVWATREGQMDPKLSFISLKSFNTLFFIIRVIHTYTFSITLLKVGLEWGFKGPKGFK